MIYNHLSNIVVFYVVYFLAKSRFREMFYAEFRRLSLLKRISYLFFNWQVLGIMAMAVFYVVMSWFMDYSVFNLTYPDLIIYFNARFSKEMEYIPLAIGLSYFFVYVKRQEARHLINHTRIIDLKAYIEKQHNEQMVALERIKKEYENTFFNGRSN
jgi:hypothetical protein